VPLLDELLPEYDVRERHEVALPVAPTRAFELALPSPAAPDWPFSALIRGRRLKAVAAMARA